MCRSDSLDLFQKPGSFSCQLQLLASTISLQATLAIRPLVFELVEAVRPGGWALPRGGSEFALILPRWHGSSAAANIRRRNPTAGDLVAKGSVHQFKLRQTAAQAPPPGTGFSRAFCFSAGIYLLFR